jgi:hypothetical protein
MVPFRQPILPGDVGSDILAVKHALRRMGIKGAGAMNMSRRASHAFVTTLGIAQRQHGVAADGKYEMDTHAFIAPHFNTADQVLYRSATIRKLVPPPPPTGDAATNAKKLLTFRSEGKYHADSGGDLDDIEATAAGKPVRSRSGKLVHVDERMMRVLVHLIESGHTIG